MGNEEYLEYLEKRANELERKVNIIDLYLRFPKVYPYEHFKKELDELQSVYRK